MKNQSKLLAVTTALFVGIVSTSVSHADEKSNPAGMEKGHGNTMQAGQMSPGMMQGGQGGMMKMMAQMNEMMAACNKMMQDKAAHHGGHKSSKPDQEKKN